MSEMHKWFDSTAWLPLAWPPVFSSSFAVPTREWRRVSPRRSMIFDLCVSGAEHLETPVQVALASRSRHWRRRNGGDSFVNRSTITNPACDDMNKMLGLRSTVGPHAQAGVITTGHTSGHVTLFIASRGRRLVGSESSTNYRRSSRHDTACRRAVAFRLGRSKLPRRFQTARKPMISRRLRASRSFDGATSAGQMAAAECRGRTHCTFLIADHARWAGRTSWAQVHASIACYPNTSPGSCPGCHPALARASESGRRGQMSSLAAWCRQRWGSR